MSRILRRNMPIVPNVGNGILDYFDNQVKTFLRITDDEYDYLCESCTDDELVLLIKDHLTFSERRQIIIILHKHLKSKNNE